MNTKTTTSCISFRLRRNWALADCRTQRRYMTEDAAKIWPPGLSASFALWQAQQELVSIRKQRTQA